ncbi:TET3 dioxygenase, partial [Atractosteus spatula]|nr:TET3 dioxygenase [Atractosteus spatula]
MRKSRGNNPEEGPPHSQDIYDFSLEGDEPKIFLRGGGGTVSPLVEYIRAEHQHYAAFPALTAGLGLFAGPPESPGTADSSSQKKKRKRCGVCIPCLRRENCGSCTNCFNRKTGHQICKLRKCIELKKKKGNWSSLVSVGTLVGSVDGPRRGQMEVGSSDHAEENGLNLGLINGASRQPKHQQNPANGCWDNQEAHPDLPCTTDSTATTTSTFAGATHNDVDMEDARNLVAFSTTPVSMLPPYSTAGIGMAELQTMHLYEKFNQEMNTGGVSSGKTEAKGGSVGTGDGCTEDLNTLQMALKLAKHGTKPPNCNCDGPECPDYLEWLEKKIKLATGDEKQCSAPNTSPQPQPLNRASQCPLPLSASTPVPPDTVNAEDQAVHPEAPLPYSPSALSIAKEKNISLQTAIAIEALTQLSSTVPQTVVPPGESSSANHPSNIQPHQTMETPTCFPIRPSSLQALQPCKHHTSPHPSVSPFAHSGPSSQPLPGNTQVQWQSSCEKPRKPVNNWMMVNSQQPSFPGCDPMSELQQLLGDTSGKYIGKSSNKIPEILQQQHPQLHNEQVKDKGTSVARVKQEPFSGEDFPGKFYGMANGQQSRHPISPGSAIHHKTQVALQQHLNHKRSLFQDQSDQTSALPSSFQDLRKWWPHPGGDLSIKQELKEIKKKKTSQTSQYLKQQQALLGLQPQMPQLTKPKQIIIKKPKQKASIPPFLPQFQITVQKPRKLEESPTTTPAISTLSSCIPESTSTPPAPTSQPSLSSDGLSLNSEGRTAQASSGLNIPEEPLNSTSLSASGISSSAPDGLNSIDDKFEELIRQFEAELEDRCPSVPQPLQEALLQQQQHRVLEDPFTIPFSSPHSPVKKIKVESSGGITVLSTTACFSTEDETPTKNEPPLTPSLSGFLESPLRYLDTPTKSLLDTPAKDAQSEFPMCDCVEQIIEKDEGPYYTHLGSGPNVASIRELMESRYGEKGEAVRIEKVIYTGKEGKSSQGCPIAKWVIRRASEAEKLLCLVRKRAGHHCAHAVVIILILAWEGVPRELGDKLYREISETLTKYGNPTSRRCGLNDDRTCACQGKDPETCGASFSFGCSWSMYFNGCKYARSKTPRKFRLQGDNPKEEENLRDHFQDLATKVAPLYKRLAPQAYSNQTATEKSAPDCRLGLKEGRPFSGVTACMDFCAHAHKDQHNLYNGCTVVCTLTKEDNRTVGQIPEDEQLHVLPLYKVSLTDEFGSEERQRQKIESGAIQVLTNFRREVRKLPEPAKSCRQRKLEAKKAASEKKKGQKQLETPEKIMKTELSHMGPPTQQHCNKGIPKQEVKPTIKMEPKENFKSYNGNSNGVLESYSVLGNCRPSDPYSMNSVYSYPSYYARNGLPATSPNGFHPNLPVPYSLYNYPPNHIFPPQFLNYDGHSARRSFPSPLIKMIKQEPIDSPQYTDCGGAPGGDADPPTRDDITQGSIQGPSPGPQHEQWPGYKMNGNLGSESWDSNRKVSTPHDGATTPLPSPSPSPSIPLTPSPAPSCSPHVPNTSWGTFGRPGEGCCPSPNPQGKSWNSNGYNANLKRATPVGGFPDKLWCKDGEGRGSTPLGLQEKAWKSCGGSAAASTLTPTPVPTPEGRLYPDAFQASDITNNKMFWDPYGLEGEEKMEQQSQMKEEEEVWSDSEHNFLDPNIGGVAVAPAHGSILIECARRELHATTPLKKPNRCHPTRISLVFYQHKNLNQPCHGLALWEAKMKLLAERARQRQEEAARLGLPQEDIKAYGKKRKWGAAGSNSSAASGNSASGQSQSKDKKEGIHTRHAPTPHTNSLVTVSPYAHTQLTGPYSRWV